MPKAPKPLPPTISLRIVGATLRTNEENTHTFLDVTFVCGFSDAEEGLSGGLIDVCRDDISTVAQFGECAYLRIGQLLVSQRKAKRSKQQAK
jgi:hypothetical protein